MNVRQTIAASLRLLNRRDRRILALVTAVQMSTAALDLLGVLLLGLVTALFIAVSSGTALPSSVESILARFGIDEAGALEVAVVLAAIAALVLISKSVLNVFLSRRVLRFLANRQAIVSGRLAAALLSRPLVQVQQRSSQQTAYALTEGVTVATMVVLGQAVIAVTEITLLVVLALGLLVISPVVTLFTVIFFVGVALILQRVLSGWASRIGRRAATVNVASLATVQESLRTYREIVVSHRRGSYVQRFQDLRWQAALVESDMQFMQLAPKYVFEIALVVGAGLLAVSQLATRELTAAVAVIAVFLAAGTRVIPSMLRLQTAAIVVRNSAGKAETHLHAGSRAGAQQRSRHVCGDHRHSRIPKNCARAWIGGTRTSSLASPLSTFWLHTRARPGQRFLM